MNKLSLFTLLVLSFLNFSILSPRTLSAFDETIITVPAEEEKGVTLELEKGEYLVTFAAGAITLFYPINPHYSWLISTAIGTNVTGGQDEPNLGTIYFKPYPAARSQSEAEAQAAAAEEKNVQGTSLPFTLNEKQTVRFWVSDFDYTDNSGMIKLKIEKK